jgi:hypothetical protein
VKIPAWATFPRTRPKLQNSWIPQVVQNYLLPHEHMVITVHKHPGVFIGHCLVAGCWCVAACLVTALTDSALALGVVWGVFLVLVAWLAVRVAAWLESYFVATETRLIFITGLVTKKAVSIPLREIRTLEGRRSPLGRLAGYGEFVAEPATPGYAIPRMNYMPYLEQLLAEMHDLMRPKDSED